MKAFRYGVCQHTAINSQLLLLKKNTEIPSQASNNNQRTTTFPCRQGIVAYPSRSLLSFTIRQFPTQTNGLLPWQRTNLLNNEIFIYYSLCGISGLSICPPDPPFWRHMQEFMYNSWVTQGGVSSRIQDYPELSNGL